MNIKIERATGLANVILQGKTVILDFIKKDGTHDKHYHRYKTRAKAEYMWTLWGRNHNAYEIAEK